MNLHTVVCSLLILFIRTVGITYTMVKGWLFPVLIHWSSLVFDRILQEKLDQPVSAPPSPRDVSMEIDSPENMMRHIRFLKDEVERLKKSLRTTELQREFERLMVNSEFIMTWPGYVEPIKLDTVVCHNSEKIWCPRRLSYGFAVDLQSIILTHVFCSDFGVFNSHMDMVADVIAGYSKHLRLQHAGLS